MGESRNIYTDHFGLKDRPFSLTPDPDFLFWSASHQRAFTMLEFGILTRAPVTVLSGEIGAGKTTLVWQLLRTTTADVQITLVTNAQGDRTEILRWVLLALGLQAQPDESHVDLFARFRAHLSDVHAQGQRVVLVFDEAQNLGADNLEELRMYTNLNSGRDEVLQLVLVGQPELRDTVHHPAFRQFGQLVSATFHLNPLDAMSQRAYIAHRIRAAGAERDIFSATASDLIHDVTGGVPRLVNQLCELALIYAFTAEAFSVSRATVQQVLDDGVFLLHHPVPQEPVFRAGHRALRSMTG